MISINTNLSSLIAQNSLNTSTNKLNETIERMSSGYKINHAKDNAANYSISTNMTTKIGAYSVAQDNAAMGLDMVTTASETINEMQNHAERLRALATQARNGTYGQQSLNAIQEEANALVDEIDKLYNTAKFNGISLFNQKEYDIPEYLKTAGTLNGENLIAKEEYNDFIANPIAYEQSYVDGLTPLSEEKSSFTKSIYKIEDVADLVKLAELTNAGEDTTGKLFILAKDIDLKEYCKSNLLSGGWIPIGDDANPFKGTFNGNGHVISNLIINQPYKNFQGLFGKIESGSIENLGLDNISIKGAYTIGSLAGSSTSDIINCFIKGEISISGSAGGLVGGSQDSIIKDCYTTCNIKGKNSYIGGLVGHNTSEISNCYTTGNIEGNTIIGGIAGYSAKKVSNCYTTGNLTAKTNYLGGIIGDSRALIENCYSTGDINGSGKYIGGIAGSTRHSVNKSYATGNIIGNAFTGGIVGRAHFWIQGSSNNYDNNGFLGKVNGSDLNSTGSFIGGINNTNDGVNIYEVKLNNAEVLAQDVNLIGGCFMTDDTYFDYDMSALIAGIQKIQLKKTSTSLQIGINEANSSQIEFDTNFDLGLSVFKRGITSNSMFNAIDGLITLLSEKQTELGSVSNRLESVLDEIATQYDNLVSSRSTLRDADMAELSSTYIQQQILQEASATLMATANQMPAIALQLL